MNFVPSIRILLVWSYVRAECTHRDYLCSVELITWGTTSLLSMCVYVVSVWVSTWVHVYKHTIVLPLRYISHTQRHQHTHYKEGIHTNYCPEHQFKRVHIMHLRYKVARGFPMKWQLHWITVQLYLQNTRLMTHLQTHLHTRAQTEHTLITM